MILFRALHIPRPINIAHFAGISRCPEVKQRYHDFTSADLRNRDAYLYHPANRNDMLFPGPGEEKFCCQNDDQRAFADKSARWVGMWAARSQDHFTCNVTSCIPMPRLRSTCGRHVPNSCHDKTFGYATTPSQVLWHLANLFNEDLISAFSPSSEQREI